MAGAVSCLPGARIGVAVSGGGDSLALLVMLRDWAETTGAELYAATVDHGLRPESAAEATQVAAVCGRLGVPHSTLLWTGYTGQGNLQAEARMARQSLLAGWALDVGIDHICLGHTRDDQAETVLMRLARGSGVDGLSGMAVVRPDPSGVIWLRPLLDVRREALRDVLRRRSLVWAEDPSNGDLRFDRVKMRDLLSRQDQHGLGADRLADTAERMSAASRVLRRVAYEAALTLLDIEDGDIVFPARSFAELEDETRWRLLSMALCRVASQSYRPRLKTLRSAEIAAMAGRRTSLHGCLVGVRQGLLRIQREPSAAARHSLRAPGLWDGRWQVEGPASAGPPPLISALGETGLALRPDWRASGRNRIALLASPAIWENGMVTACPLLDPASEWHAKLIWDKTMICDALLTH
ncbi:tRNA lysidine(34) synthetase TilS [Pseudoruegeria sp. SK021]|nr:tRNA lysidine(34) synthetase TilS [Pseudoruegeria sp. SK021]